jgi:hypothetical protein
MGQETGYPDTPCIAFRLDRDIAVFGLVYNPLEHSIIGMSVSTSQVAQELLNRFSCNWTPDSFTNIL